MYLTKRQRIIAKYTVIKHKQLIFTSNMITVCGIVSTERYVTSEQSTGNDAVQSLITGSRENRVHSWRIWPGPGTEIRAIMKAKQSRTCEIYWHI